MESVVGMLDVGVSVMIGLLLLVVLVVVHELGHAIAARRNGVVVEEFGIGFPPRAWKKKLKNGVLFTLNWLPLGGFVKLQGEHDSARGKGDYGAASLWVKTKILLAGVGVNWLVAVVIFTVLALVGMPKILDNQWTAPMDTVQATGPVVAVTVAADSPASEAGLQPGDELTVFAGERVVSPEQLVELTSEKRGETVPMTYERDGQEATTTATLREEGEGGYLGIGPSQEVTLRSTWSAPFVGIATTVQFTVATLQGIGTLLVDLGTGLVSQLSTDEAVRNAGSEQIGRAGDQVAGPVGILGVIFPAAREAGVVSLLMLTGIISLTLAIMNTLPIPALDGGRLFVTLLFHALRKPLKKATEERIHGSGFMVLIGLIILITIVDVGRIVE